MNTGSRRQPELDEFNTDCRALTTITATQLGGRQIVMVCVGGRGGGRGSGIHLWTSCGGMVMTKSSGCAPFFLFVFFFGGGGGGRGGGVKSHGWTTRTTNNKNSNGWKEKNPTVFVEVTHSTEILLPPPPTCPLICDVRHLFHQVLLGTHSCSAAMSFFKYIYTP